MAFFKFRWPGQGEQAQAEKPSKRPRTPQAESIEVMRRRARHRLIGAAVLVLIGVIGFPMLFDTQPRPIPVDIPIEIPDRNKVAPLVVPAPVAEAPGAAKPSTPSSQDVATAPRPTPQRSNNAVGNGLADGEELVQGSRSAASKPAPAAPAKPEIKPEPKPEPKPPVPSEPKPVQRPDEAARARALLEGRSAEPAAAAATAEEARFIVQVGALKTPVYKKQTTLPVDIIPLSHPYQLNDGDTLTVKILFKGEPLVNTKIRTWHKLPGTVIDTSLMSNEKGEISFPVSTTGEWMVSCVTIMRHSDDPKAQWQSYWGSLTWGYTGKNKITLLAR